MSKTNFVDGDPSQGILGTVVPADFLNAVNKHHHTGLDQDGHGALPYAADTGTANAYVVNLNPVLTQYVIGMPVFFKAANANTGTSTIEVNTLGAKTIKKNITQDLGAGDIQAGQIVMVLYDGVNFQLIGGLDAHTVDGYHASATPAVNTVPVTGAGNTLARGFIPDNVPGVLSTETSTGNASALTITSTPTDILLVDLGAITAGDRIFYQIHQQIIKGATAGTTTWQFYKYAGTATIEIFHNTNVVFRQFYHHANETDWYSTSGIIKVTGSGALQMKIYAYSAGSNASVNAGAFQLYTVFLKKQ
jgi:hypothetical protein